MRGIFDLPLDLLFLPVSIGYYFYGRFALAKTFLPVTNAMIAVSVIKTALPVLLSKRMGGHTGHLIVKAA